MKILNQFKHFVTNYNNLCQKKPLATITLSTGIILGLGDCITQQLEIYYKKKQIYQEDSLNENKVEFIINLKEIKFDFRRSVSMAAYGFLCYGPYSYFWYCRILPRIVPLVPGVQITNKQIFQKVLLDETIQNWFFYSSFLYLLTVFEGGNHKQGIDKLKKDFLTCYLTDLMIWPFIQFVNFKKVPIHLQSLVVSTATIFWGAFLSYIQHR